MPTILYQINKNNITEPPSYYAQVQPRAVLNVDDVARLINQHNPTIPVKTAKSVVEHFADEVALQLASGYTVNINNFCSFVVTLGGRMTNPTDPLPTDAFDIRAKASTTFKTMVYQESTFERTGYNSKVPSIVSGIDTNTEIHNYIRDGYGFRIDGTQLAFDPTDATQGVFLLSQAGNSIKQENVSLVLPKKIIIVPSLDPAAGPAGDASVEQILTVKAKYTENGELREGTFKTIQRTTLVISDTTTDQCFVTGSAASGPAEIGAYAGAQVDAILQASIGNDNILRLSIGTLAGVFGDAVSVTATGDFVLSGLVADVTVTVTDYETLYANVLSYGRYMKEVLDLSPLTP